MGVGRFDRKKWDEHKSRIVEEGNYHKFTKGKESADMRTKLLATGDRELVEVSRSSAEAVHIGVY